MKASVLATPTSSRADQVQGRTGEPLTYRASRRATVSTVHITFDAGGVQSGVCRLAGGIRAGRGIHGGNDRTPES